MVRLFGIPRYVQQRLRRFRRESLVDRLWQVFLVVVGGFAVYLMFSSGGILLAFVAGTILSIFLADDIRQLASDIWNRNWAEVRVNLGR